MGCEVFKGWHGTSTGSAKTFASRICASHRTSAGTSSWQLVLAPRHGALCWQVIPTPCPDISPCRLFVALLSWHFISLPDDATTRRPHNLTSRFRKRRRSFVQKTNRANSDADPNIDLDPDLDSASDSDSDSEYSESDAAAETPHLTTRHVLMPTQTPT